MIRVMNAGFSTREIAKLLKMPEQRIRALVRAGIVQGALGQDAEGRTEPHFDFRDLLVLRMAGRLLATGLSPQRVKRAMLLLRQQVEGSRPLSGVQVFTEGRRVLASAEGVVWEPESGQQHLRFAAPAPRAEVPTSRPAAALKARATTEESADSWFDAGLAWEDSEPYRAYEAYLKALEIDPEHVEANINIGRLCSTAGELARAAAYFRQALRLDPSHPVANFNLAVTLHDLGDLDGARDAYRAALEADPYFADAHYNLATLLQQQGDEEGAARHMEAYEQASRNTAE